MTAERLPSVLKNNRDKQGESRHGAGGFLRHEYAKKDAFSVYQALRERLVRSGEFTENEIAFVHDAANDKQRLAMFEKVNNAEIKSLSARPESSEPA